MQHRYCSRRGFVFVLIVLLAPMTAAQPVLPTAAGSVPVSPVPHTKPASGAMELATSSSLGTVIFTRAEREAIPATASVAVTATDTSGAKSASLRFDGYAKPERGPAVVWINGQADTPADAVQDRAGGVIVRTNRQHGRALKPGQTDTRDEFAGGNSVVLHDTDASASDRRLRAAGSRADRAPRSN